MSGPIVRKYGFPNFEQIFGKREVQHGVEEEGGPAAESAPPPAEGKTDPATSNDPAKPPFDAKVSPPTQFGSAVE